MHTRTHTPTHTHTYTHACTHTRTGTHAHTLTHVHTLYEDMSNITPLVFILSTGSDPMSSFLRFAKEMGYLERYCVHVIQCFVTDLKICEMCHLVTWKLNASDYITMCLHTFVALTHSHTCTLTCDVRTHTTLRCINAPHTLYMTGVCVQCVTTCSMYSMLWNTLIRVCSSAVWHASDVSNVFEHTVTHNACSHVSFHSAHTLALTFLFMLQPWCSSPKDQISFYPEWRHGRNKFQKSAYAKCCPYLGWDKTKTYRLYEESLCRKVHLRWFSKNGACMSVNALLKLVLMPKKRNKNWTSCLYLGPPPSILSVTKLHFQPLTFRRLVGDFYRVL